MESIAARVAVVALAALSAMVALNPAVAQRNAAGGRGENQATRGPGQERPARDQGGYRAQRCHQTNTHMNRACGGASRVR
jgi:hypothetical protein